MLVLHDRTLIPLGVTVVVVVLTAVALAWSTSTPASVSPAQAPELRSSVQMSTGYCANSRELPSVVSRGRSATLDSVTDQHEVRIGTTERERAHNALSEHFSEGRPDINEFEERSELTAAARTPGDLARLFRDLPGGLPGALTAPRLGRPGKARRCGAPVGG